MAVGGRGSLHGAILGAILVNYAKTYLTGTIPEIWLFAQGGLFVAVTLFLPKGIVGTLPAFSLGGGKGPLLGRLLPSGPRARREERS